MTAGETNELYVGRIMHPQENQKHHTWIITSEISNSLD